MMWHGCVGRFARIDGVWACFGNWSERLDVVVDQEDSAFVRLSVWNGVFRYGGVFGVVFFRVVIIPAGSNMRVANDDVGVVDVVGGVFIV